MHVAQQQDAAVFVVHGARFDHAVVVHHAFEQVIDAFGGEDHFAAMRGDCAAVADTCCLSGYHTLVNAEADQVVAGEVEGDVIAGGKIRLAQVAGDGSFVGDGGRNQHDVAAVRCGDAAQVGD